MTCRTRSTLLCQPSDISPSQVDWEVVGVFNPAVVAVGDELVMLARVAERPTERHDGQMPLPRWLNGRLVSDWVVDAEVMHVDARVVMMKDTKALRLTSVSHFQVFRQSSTSDTPWAASATVVPEEVYEEFGIEDPRISKIDGIYWITYVAVSRQGALTALMSSPDMIQFKRHGIIFPCENKDVVLFPQRINGEYVALHRPNPRSHFSPPQIWIARSPDLIHWGQHEAILQGCQRWESDRVGSGTPPILTDQGWLVLYHASESSSVVGAVGQYAAGAMLLDRFEPSRVIARSTQPIMTPSTDYETDGFVPNVVFPTAVVEAGELMHVYYGAADSYVAVAEFSKQTVMNSMTKQDGGTR